SNTPILQTPSQNQTPQTQTPQPLRTQTPQPPRTQTPDFVVPVPIDAANADESLRRLIANEENLNL
ncbi:799_t:CDS:2, partial [Cetraspora pellucida]